MKCACVSSYYGPYYGNFIASLLALHNKMIECGHEMCYIFPHETENFNWIKIFKKKSNSVYCIPFNGSNLSDILKLRDIFKKEKVDLIYSRMCGWDFAAHFAAPFTPIIWHMDMYVNVDTFIKRIKNWLKFHILGFGKTYHLAVSNAVADIINTFTPKHRCIGIPNALDFQRLPKDFITFSKKKYYQILVFGWAPIIKGLDTVLDACENLNIKRKLVELNISAQNMTYEFVNKRYNMNIPEWIKLLPPTDKIQDIYSQCDIMISASRSEGFSYCLAEALFCGMPIFYSNIPGTSWAKEFQAVNQFQVGDTQDLCRAIKKCIEYGITFEQQMNNRKLLKTKYSMDSWAKNIVEYFELIKQ